MAYDQNGNYYFNPQIDSEDASLLEQADKLEHIAAFKQSQFSQAEMANRRAKNWSDTLKDEGLSQEEANQILAEDKEFANQLDKKLMMAQVRAIKERKGRKTAPQPRVQGQQQFVREAPLPPEGPGYKKKLQDLRDKGKPRLNSKGEMIAGRRLTYEDEMSVIDTLFQTPEETL